jgi:hypothetical protein
MANGFAERAVYKIDKREKKGSPLARAFRASELWL